MSRVVVVTGGAKGIGKAVADRFGGDRVEAVGHDVLDVTDEQAVTAFFERVGPVDVLVNNAGAVGGAHLARVMPLLETQRTEALSGAVTTPLDALVRISDDEWRRLLAVHLDGTFFCTRAAARLMAPRASGAIVNMASVCGIEGCTGHPHYSAAKAGILGFTRAVAKELIVQGIRVNAVAPGHVDTGTLKGRLDASRRVVASQTPAGRLARPEEIAATVAFLASDDASYYVGATLGPNGGLVTAV
jgi:3-oxoacyl-[acyl-carrier protein] reductase